MQVKYVFVIYCAAPLLLHMADSQEYCNFKGPSNQYAHCSLSETNHAFYYVPSISRRIEYIDLKGQPLKQLPRNAFGNITTQNELVTIILAHCYIHYIDVDAFENLENLENFNISANSISRFETGTFQHTKKLLRLFMGFNKVETLQTGLFHNLIHLKEVSFKNNNITCIDIDTFRNTPSLERINLHFNKLEYLSPLFADKFVNYLYIGDNPWNCDCNMKEFHGGNRRRNYVHMDFNLICQNPPELRGKKWTDLTSDSFKCDARIISPKNDIRVVTLGSNVTLSCVVSAVPVPNIEWHRGSNIIARYDVFGNTNMTMHYLNYTFTVQEEVLGEYYCSTHNTDELEKSSTTLTMNVTTK